MLIRVSGYVITVLILIHKQGTAHSCNNKPAIRGGYYLQEVTYNSITLSGMYCLVYIVTSPRVRKGIFHTQALYTLMYTLYA